jgi:hypothetical protein
MRMLTLLFCLPFLFISCHSLLFIHWHDDKTLISVEQFDWFVGFPPRDDFKLNKMRISEDHNGGYFVFTNTRNNSIVSFYIEPIIEEELTRNCIDSKCLRDVSWQNLRPTLKSPTNIRFYEIEDAAIFDYTINDPINQINLFAYLCKDGYRIDVHISKVLFEESDKEYLINFVKSLSYERK